jgi:NTP pyrophosphatase (non-canonical NTP hydrolase)
MNSLKIADYQKQALLTDQRPSGGGDLAFPLLGVFGETGSLLSEVKKKQRDPVAYVGYQDTVVEELGDVLWYISALAARAQIGLDELAVNLDRTLANWQASGSPTIVFEAVEAQVTDVAASPSPAFERTLLALAGEVGLLMTDHNAGRLERNRSALKGRLVAVLRALRSAAHEAGVTLEVAARANLTKIFDRWPTERVHPPLFDDSFPSHEQLPRHLVIDIAEVEINGRKKCHASAATGKVSATRSRTIVRMMTITVSMTSFTFPTPHTSDGRQPCGACFE